MKKIFLIMFFLFSFNPIIKGQDSLLVKKLEVQLTPLRYSNNNFLTFADSSGVYIKIITPITIGELEKFLEAVDVYLNYNKIFKP